jgi:hypothetical protein
MLLKATMLAALRLVRERWRLRAEAWETDPLDHRMRRELGLPPRHDPPRPGWF